MLGKGLESLIPPDKNRNQNAQQPAGQPSPISPSSHPSFLNPSSPNPPADLPIAEDAPIEFTPSLRQAQGERDEQMQAPSTSSVQAPGLISGETFLPNAQNHSVGDLPSGDHIKEEDAAAAVISETPKSAVTSPVVAQAPSVSETKPSSPNLDFKTPYSSRFESYKTESKSEIKGPRNEKVEEYVFYIEVEKIRPNPDQPRRHFSDEAIRDLASSIREFGVLQPIVVTKKIKDTENGADVEYELIAGERRLRAVKLLGLSTIPAIVRNVDLERERLELAVIENLQRENLNIVEVARAYARLQDEFRMTQREVAAKLGKSRESVANTLRLLDLPVHIQDALQEGKLSESHGRLLLAIPDPAAQQKLFEELLQKPMTTRELKSRVQSLSDKGKEEKAVSPELKMFQERLSSELGAPVLIEQSGSTGKITIRFYSPEELQSLIHRLAKEEEF